MRKRNDRLGSTEAELFSNFGRAVKKVRARIKLLDDTDTGPENLISLMDLVRERAPVLFAHPTSWLIQAISRSLRPDIGVYFVGDAFMATSHTVLPTMGFTPEVIRSAGPGEFTKLGKYNYDFAVELGAFLAQLGRVLALHGRALDLKPPPCRLDLTVTHNDFIGARFYAHAQRGLHGARRSALAALTVCLAQVNQALHVLPHLLGNDSNLLRRIRYLTAYHATSTISATFASPPAWAANKADVIVDKSLRNVMAHYELRDAVKFAIGASDPLGAAISGLTGTSSEAVSAAVHARLGELSDLLGAGLTKTSLKPARALLGSHT